MLRDSGVPSWRTLKLIQFPARPISSCFRAAIQGDKVRDRLVDVDVRRGFIDFVREGGR